jgi:DNA-binding SARP family transcriptional activator
VSSVHVLKLALLGGHRAEMNGEAIRWRNRKSLALLALLALAPRRCSKDWLASMLWADGSRVQARVNLRNLVFHTRRSLGPAAGVLDDLGEDFRLDSNAHSSDVAEFLDFCERPERAFDAVRLYDGELLAGFDLSGNEPFDEWLAGERQRLHRTYVRAIRIAFDRARLGRDPEQALSVAQRWIAAEPYDERGRRALMRSLLHTGNRPAAIAAYRDWEATVRRDLGTVPAPATVELFRRIPGQEFSSTRLPRVVPLFRSLFVGRERDLLWLEQQSAVLPESRLILIRGEAGVGRTRLLREYGAVLGAAGDVVLLGRTPPGPALPLQSLADAIRAWLTVPSGDPAAVFGALAAVDLAELARLLPEIRRYRGGLPEPLPGWPEEVTRRLAVVVAGMLREIQRQAATLKRRLVLCVDDLQASNEETLDALAGFLVNGQPSLVVASVRGDNGPRMARWLDEIRGAVAVVARTLRRLSQGDTQRLLSSMGRPGPQPILDALAATIHERSGGSPKIAVRLMRELFEGGGLSTGADGAWRLSAALQSLSGELSPDLPTIFNEVLDGRIPV